MPKPAWLSIEPSDVAGRWWVDVKITPSSQQDEMLRMQMAQAFRASGADGAALMSDVDILRDVMRDPHAEEKFKRAQLQLLEKTDPEVQGLVQASLRAEWRKLHPATVKAAEKELAPDEQFKRQMAQMTPEAFKQLVDTIAQAKAVELAGGPPVDQQAQMAQQAAAAQASAPVPPPTALPYQENGPSPEVAPTQFGMTQAPQPMMATPDIIATQMRRGRPQP